MLQHYTTSALTHTFNSFAVRQLSSSSIKHPLAAAGIKSNLVRVVYTIKPKFMPPPRSVYSDASAVDQCFEPHINKLAGVG